MTDIVDVAAAVLLRADGTFLLAQRPAGKVYAEYWEFPGGKVELNEPPARALARELHEELGVDVDFATPWITRVFSYAHATVRLHFFRVWRWHGEPHGREGQAVAWQRIDALTVGPMLPANTPVLRALALPTEYGISNAAEVGEEIFLAALGRRLDQGLRLIQVREKSFTAVQLARFAVECVRAARAAGAIVLINGDERTAHAANAHGVHLTAAQLAAVATRPDFEYVGASVHTLAELRKAEALGVDFAVLGPVSRTPTHTDSTTLGWDRFASIAQDASLPVFAIGGLTLPDMERAWRHGAHGLAMIRGAWR